MKISSIELELFREEVKLEVRGKPIKETNAVKESNVGRYTVGISQGKRINKAVFE